MIVRRLKILFPLIFSLLIASVCALNFVTVFAEDPITVTRVETDESSIKYMHFSNVTALAVSSDSFFIANGSNVDQVSKTDFAVTPLNPFSSDVKKMIHYNGYLFTLTQEGIYKDGVSIVDKSDIVDFSVANGIVYACIGDTLYAYNDIGTELNSYSHTAPLYSVATFGTSIYLTCDNEILPDLKNIVKVKYYVDTFTNEGVAYEGISSIKDVVAISENALVILDGDGISLYDVFGGGLFISGTIYGKYKYISYDGEFIYAVTSLNSIEKISATFDSRTVITASAHTANGFYFAPSGISSRRNKIFVADTYNDRIAIIEENLTSYILGDISRPTAVVSDYNGDVYVAHSRYKIGKYALDGSTIQQINYDATVLLDVVDLKITSNGIVYALSADNKIYVIENGELKYLTDGIAFDVSPTTDELYYAYQGKIMVYGETPTEVCSYTEVGISGMFIDHNDVAYVLSGMQISTYKSGVTTAVKTYDVTANGSKFTSIIMNTTTFLYDYGDVLLTDTLTHTVKRIQGSLLGVNDGFAPKTDLDDLPDTLAPTPTNDSNRIIYKLDTSAEVYPQPVEINANVVLSKDMRVIIPQFNANDKFTYIIADNILGGTNADAIAGYVYTSTINPTPLPYTSSHPETCYNYIQNVAIYKYPTRNSPIVEGFASLEKDTGLILKDFVYTTKNDVNTYGYVDNYVDFITWYRVSYGANGEYEGYVTSDYISLRQSVEDPTVYPRINAKIVGSSALTYIKNADGTFSIIEDMPAIEVGTKVEVVGTFDSSEPYTKIKYHVAPYGTLTVWVLTKNVKYTGINAVQIAAIVIIIATALLILGIVFRMLYLKRTRKMRDMNFDKK